MSNRDHKTPNQRQYHTKRDIIRCLNFYFIDVLSNMIISYLGLGDLRVDCYSITDFTVDIDSDQLYNEIFLNLTINKHEFHLQSYKPSLLKGYDYFTDISRHIRTTAPTDKSIEWSKPLKTKLQKWNAMGIKTETWSTDTPQFMWNDEPYIIWTTPKEYIIKHMQTDFGRILRVELDYGSGFNPVVCGLVEDSENRLYAVIIEDEVVYNEPWTQVFWFS